jgi:hypothetical protein
MIGVPSFDTAVPAAATLRDVVGGVYEAQMGRALAWERYAPIVNKGLQVMW